MTVGWSKAGQPREVEIRVNEQPNPTKVTLSGGLVKKKNLKRGDHVSFRVMGADGRWSEWRTFEHDGGLPHPPPPRVALEIAEDPNRAAALVEFDPVSGCTKYEVQLFPLDGHSEDWVKVSDSLTAPAVKKKNLSSKFGYSFRYRGWSTNGWSNWSAASVPEVPPERNLLLTLAITPKLMRTDGSFVDAGSLGGKLIALYFSAHWCPPCRQFTPKLVEFYRSMRAMGKPFEVVFVSADQDEQSFKQYFNEMGWLAIPFDDPRREGLSAEHGVRGIPSLKILSSKSGKVIEADAIRFPLNPTTLDAWYARMLFRLGFQEKSL
jgi:thiol-disulfide isomerase/thioredoxin